MKSFLFIYFSFLTVISLQSKEKLPENYFTKLSKAKTYAFAFKKALDTIEYSNTSPKLIFEAKSFIAIHQLNKNNVGSAAKFLKELQPNNALQQYILHDCYAYYYYYINEPYKEFNQYLKAKEILNTANFYDPKFNIYNGLTQFYLDHKNSEKAIATCQDFQKELLNHKIKYNHKKINFFRYEAEAYSFKKKYSKTFSKIDSSIYYAKHYRDTAGIYLAKRLKSYVFLEQKEYKKALQIALNLESGVYNKNNIPFYERHHLLNHYTLGKIYFEKKEFKKAKFYLQKIAYAVLDFPYHDIYFSAVKIYTKILTKENNHLEAYRLLSIMEEKKDSIYNSHQFSKILNKEIDYIQEKEEIHYEIKELKWKWLIIVFLTLSISLVFLYIFRLKNIKNLKDKNKLIKDKNKELNILNDSLEKFAQITSHDLKAPIRSIGHLTTFIQEDEPNISKESKKNLEYIQSSVENSNNLILNMLALAKSNDKNITKEKVNTWVIFRAVESNLLKMISDSNAKIIYNKKLPVFIEGNQSLLIQLFQNIIQNSIKYAQKGIDPLIEISAIESGKSSVFHIKDNGIGIKENKKKSLFNAFSQEHFESIDKGVGLGLYITKKIADIHNAKITMSSNNENGTIVGIIFNKT